jgi:threonine dehydrogenase-like Zn-dependent dehydrogenase
MLKTTVTGANDGWVPLVIDEVTLVGSRCGPFDQALLALERGHVQVPPLISDRFRLSRRIDALARAQTNPVLKVLLDVS